MTPGERWTDGHGRVWEMTEDGNPKQIVSIEEQLLRDIIRAIEGFGEDALEIDFAEDGPGYFDFMGMHVKESGRAQLKELIDKAISDIRDNDG